MNTIEQDGQRHEIIIVRRPRHDEDEAHHGGVWKIAFADFMTALMCFFLVMWLVNAANEETRAALASYFNPVKLIDRNASRKGLDEMGGPQSRESAPENADDSTDKENLTEPGQSATPPKSEPSLQKSEFDPGSDEHLFSDPYAVLSEIVADTGRLQNTSSKGDGGAQTSGPASGASGGESYRDPFAPDFWSQQIDVPEASATADAAANLAGEDAREASEETAADAAEEPAATEAAQTPLEPAPAAAEDPVPAVAPEAIAEPEVKPAQAEGEAAEAGDIEPSPTTEAAIAEAEALAEKAREAEQAAEAIRAELAEVTGENGELSEGVSVTVTDEGVVISITDEIDSGMFEIGSAVPRRDLILAMEKIGKILSDRKGRVSIHGHTDGRPFRSETYDNWRLSTARAHSAYFMLVRGGLDELRIVEVAGFADRKLKTADNPFADANRRIEILLESGG